MACPRRHVTGQSQAGVAQLVEHLICNQQKSAVNPFIINSCTFGVDVWVDGDASFAESWVHPGRNGAGNEDRTRGLKITNLALYRLSYPGLAPLYRSAHTGSTTRPQNPCTPSPRPVPAPVSPFRRLLPFGLDEFFHVPPERRSHRRRPPEFFVQMI